MERYYILNPDHTVSLARDVFEWTRNFEITNRSIGDIIIPAENTASKHALRVSTVFLGLDHAFNIEGNPDAAPLIFETMIFKVGSWRDLWTDRCSTYQQALAMHQRGINAAMNEDLLEGEDDE